MDASNGSVDGDKLLLLQASLLTVTPVTVTFWLQ